MTVSITAEFVHLLVRGGLLIFVLIVLAGLCYACYWMGSHNILAERKARMKE